MEYHPTRVKSYILVSHVRYASIILSARSQSDFFCSGMFTLGPAASECEYRLSSLSVVTTYLIIIVIFTCRTWAIWGRGKGKAAIALFAAYVASYIAMSIILVFYLRSASCKYLANFFLSFTLRPAYR